MNTENLRSDELRQRKEFFHEKTVCRLFHETAELYPDKTAVSDEEGSMTYRELDECSNFLAAQLLQDGLWPEEIVCIQTGRNINAILGMLSVWKAGGSWFYLDTCYPEEGNRALLEACRCRVHMTQDYFQDLRDKRLDEYIDHANPKGLATLIFTSGTTSMPKGVMIEHRNITAAISNFDRLGLNTRDQVSVFAGFSFVAALFDISVTLAIGAALDIIPETLRRSIDKILVYWREKHITVSFLPPHMAMKLMQHDDSEIPLRALLVGSEPTRYLDRRQFRILNVYAASEMCALISTYEITSHERVYPIGTMNPTIRWYIVDEEGRQVPEGATGELWLSGPQVCRGYYNMPELTRTQFAPNPFSEEEEFSRVFKSRDLVALLPDGNLKYVGRHDKMYKIRGYRVESSAVEYSIRKCSDVKELVVKIFTDDGGTNILCAYFTADVPVDVKAFKEKLRKIIPYYMVPTCMIQVPDFPRKRNGKIDRSRIEAPKELNDHKLLAKLY